MKKSFSTLAAFAMAAVLAGTAWAGHSFNHGPKHNTLRPTHHNPHKPGPASKAQPSQFSKHQGGKNEN